MLITLHKSSNLQKKNIDQFYKELDIKKWRKVSKRYGEVILDHLEKYADM